MSDKYIRFHSVDSADISYGLLDGNDVSVLSAAPWSGGKPIGQIIAEDQAALAAPVDPSKVVCIGLNYQAHVSASQSATKPPEYPLIFLKPSSAIIADGESIVHPPQSERVDYEAELGVVIGKTACKIEIERADDYIFGLTCVNDVTARDLQKKDGQWSRAKGFDTFCPVGPHVVTGVDYRDLSVEGILNGEIMQSGRTSQMIFDIPFLISYVSHVMTLYPGDLISTGTPSGIAPMKSGDLIEVRVEAVGSLTNRMA